jgi:hypothetical protein
VDVKQLRNRFGASLYGSLHRPRVATKRPIFSALMRNHGDEVQHVGTKAPSILRSLLPPPKISEYAIK